MRTNAVSDTDEAAPDAHKGYTDVDDQAGLETVLAGMDATASWPSVRYLRAWTNDRLDVHPGDRLLDVGCGMGDVIIELAQRSGPQGEAVGVDASAAMLEVARERAEEAGSTVQFRVGDATTLTEPDASFDCCRSERVLQWVSDPAQAIAEMVRVLRPGGRLAVIDSDWRTLTIDLPDDDAAAAAVKEAIWSLRGLPASVGTRLLNLCRDAGLVELEVTAATHIWTSWDPERTDAPPGLFPLGPVIDQMVDAGQLDRSAGRRFIDGLRTAGRSHRFFMSIGMFAVFGRTASSPTGAG